MDEATIPEAVDKTGEQDSHPVEATPAPAEDKTSETQTPDGTESSQPDPEKDRMIEWAKNKGIPTDDVSDAALKAIEVAYNGEKAFHESRQNKSLQEAIGEPKTESESQVDPETASWRREIAENRLYKAYPDAQGHEDDLAQVAKDYPVLKELYQAGYSADTSAQALKMMWEIHSGRASAANIKAAEKKGFEQAKQAIAKSSSAGTPQGNATTRTSEEKTPDEARLERFSNW